MFKDVSRIAAGTVISQGIILGFSPLLARSYEPHQFGQFAVVFASASLASVFVTLKLDMLIATVRTYSGAWRLFQVLWWCSLGVGVIAILAGAIVGLLSICGWFAFAKGAEGALLFSFLTVGLSGSIGVRAWRLRKRRYAEVANTQIERSIVLVSAWFVCALIGGKLLGVGLTIGQIVAEVYVVIRGLVSLPIRERRMLFRPRLSSLKPALIANIGMVRALVVSQAIGTAFLQLPVIAVAIAFGPVPAGHYALAERLAAAPAALLARSIAEVFRQRASQRYGAGAALTPLMCQALIIAFSLSFLPILFGIVVVVPEIELLFGPKWEGVGSTLSLLLLVTMVSFNTAVIDSVSIILKKARYIVWWNSARCACDCLWALVAIYGFVDYRGYLLLLVCSRVAFYILDGIMMFVFASSYSQTLRVDSASCGSSGV